MASARRFRVPDEKHRRTIALLAVFTPRFQRRGPLFRSRPVDTLTRRRGRVNVDMEIFRIGTGLDAVAVEIETREPKTGIAAEKLGCALKNERVARAWNLFLAAIHILSRN